LSEYLGCETEPGGFAGSGHVVRAKLGFWHLGAVNILQDFDSSSRQ
jgi:hypothetical protein